MKGVFMKKFNFRKILSLALAAFVAFGTFAAGAVSVNAADDGWYIGISDTIWTGEEIYFGVYDANENMGDITSIASSNNGVLSAQKEVYDDFTYYYVKGVTAGTATLTVNFNTSSGAQSLSQNILVKKYPKQIKSLKVNGKKVNTNKNKFFYAKKVSKKKTKVNIKMALKKGWKITNVSATRWTKNGEPKNFKVSKSAIKKGKAIKFSKKYTGMYINVEMKKGSDIINYEFNFYR